MGGRGEESDVASCDLYGGSHCLCRLRTYRLAPGASIEHTNQMLEIWAQ
jgi:hypothetical protein